MKKIIISEYKISDEQIKTYESKGYRFYYGYQKPYIPNEASIGILLDTLYKGTMDLINRLLYFKHPVTLKYMDKVYKLSTLDDWQRTYQSDKDQLKTETWRHPILEVYKQQCQEYREKCIANKRKEQYDIYTKLLDDIPNDEELDSFLEHYAPLYSISVDYDDKIQKIQIYTQIKYYLDYQFPFDKEEEDIEYFGDEEYLEDIIYKEGGALCLR